MLSQGETSTVSMSAWPLLADGQDWLQGGERTRVGGTGPAFRCRFFHMLTLGPQGKVFNLSGLQFPHL